MPEALVLTPSYDASLTLDGDNGRLVVREAADLPLEMQTAMRGPAGPTGASGEGYLNIDGGAPDSTYGGLTAIDAGGP